MFKFLEITLIINLEVSSKSIISYEKDSGSSGAIAESSNSARDLGLVFVHGGGVDHSVACLYIDVANGVGVANYF